MNYLSAGLGVVVLIAVIVVYVKIRYTAYKEGRAAEQEAMLRKNLEIAQQVKKNEELHRTDSDAVIRDRMREFTKNE